MTTTLRPLRADEIASYVPRVSTAYAAELREHLHLDDDAAEARARRSAAEAFPDGTVAEGNWLFAVEDGQGTRVGVLWLGEPTDGRPRACGCSTSRSTQSTAAADSAATRCCSQRRRRAGWGGRGSS